MWRMIYAVTILGPTLSRKIVKGIDGLFLGTLLFINPADVHQQAAHFRIRFLHHFNEVVLTLLVAIGKVPDTVRES